MLKQRTLFIIGAGASVDYGFPLGSQLINDVRTLLKLSYDTIGHLKGDKTMIAAMKQHCSQNSGSFQDYFFAAQMVFGGLRSGVLSVDNYVHTHADKPLVAVLVKMAISTLILRYETASSLNRDYTMNFMSNSLPSGTWLESFCKYHFAMHQATKLDMIFNDVAFISFNYDRCIERGLSIGIANYFGLNDDQAKKACLNLRLLFPYGSLGDLMQGNSINHLAFGSPNNIDNLLAAAKNIKTFTEGTANQNFRDEVADLLNWCQTIVFLGFGYLGLNLELLGSPTIATSKRVFGTAYGMSVGNIEALNQSIPQTFHVVNPRPFRDDLKAGQLLNHYSIDLFG